MISRMMTISAAAVACLVLEEAAAKWYNATATSYNVLLSLVHISATCLSMEMVLTVAIA